MKQFNEDDLIAYHLNELPRRRKRDLERALQTDAALASESDSVEMILRGFKGHSPLDLDPRLDHGLVQWNWQVLSPALPRYPAKSPAFFRRHRQVLAGAGLAFAAITVTLVRRHHAPAQQGPTAQPSMKSPYPTMSRQDVTTNRDPFQNGANRTQAELQRAAARRRTMHQHQQPGWNLASPTVRRVSQAPLLAAENSPRSLTSPSQPVPMPAAQSSPAPATPTQGTSSPALATPAMGPAIQVSAAGSASTRHQRSVVHHEHTTELTLAMGGTLIGYNDNDVSAYQVNRSEGATNAVIAMALLHRQFRPAAGYRVALSYSRPDFHYSGVSSINGKLYEVAATYVVQGPGRGKLSTSAEAGVGFMRITPTIKDPATGNNIRAAGVFGVAADLMISKHIGIHAAYRGQVFKSPDFQYRGDPYNNYSTPVTAGTLLSSEPLLGITYRFSHH